MFHDRFATTFLACVIAALFLAIGGCGEGELVEEVKKNAANAADAGREQAKEIIAEAVPFQPRLAFSLEMPQGKSKFEPFFARLYKLGDGLPYVLHISTYSEPKDESFPSAMLEARLPASVVRGFQDLEGQTINAKLFIQYKLDGAVYASADEAPVSIAIKKSGPDWLVTEVTGVVVSSDPTEQPANVKGQLDLILQTED